MSLEITLSIHKFFDGDLLPKAKDSERTNVLFYCVVFRQNNTDVLRMPFDHRSEKEMKLYFYLCNTIIPNKFLANSRHVRLINDDVVNVHLYKFTLLNCNGSSLGMCRIIGDESSCQDMSVFQFDVRRVGVDKNKYFMIKRTRQSSRDILKPVYSLDVFPDHPSTSPSWNTQRNFYSKMHDSMNMELYRMNCEKTIQFFSQQQNFVSLMYFITKWSNFIKPCEYVADMKWYDNNIYDDKGDAAIESTKSGDCEDFAHYYCRMFYILIHIFPFILNKNDEYFKYCASLVYYRPFVYICKIKLKNGKYDYHSTMLIVPKEKNSITNTISFEVTNNNQHIILDSRENIKTFYSWHIEHYFLVDRYHIYRMKVKDEQIENLCLKNINTEFFPY